MVQYVDWNPKGEEQERGGTEKKKKIEEIMAEKFPNSMKAINHKSKKFKEPQAQETSKNKQTNKKPKKQTTILRHIIIKTSDKEKKNSQRVKKDTLHAEQQISHWKLCE